MKRCVRAVCVAAFVAAVMFSGAGAYAQQVPAENHYKLYDYLAADPVFYGQCLTLQDQFGCFVADTVWLERFANPVDKNGEGIVDPQAHQTWWRLSPQYANTYTALVTDQFGSRYWSMVGPKFLVLPALKNPTDPEADPPLRNHYLCYQAYGPTPNVTVTLVDQFGTVCTVVMEACMFCNPVQKCLSDGTVYPIVDDCPHLACYLITDTNQYGFPVNTSDQFGNRTQDVGMSWLLCVPAHKNDATPVKESTWGRIKSLLQ
ncbi:MAG: hypothetical protein JW952_06950 [Candidatus Eisenbacteria bacterium]|nr:hypothetical protein [Candidatus Eisenbacteria bacterium]